jgi:hypothetical protein
MPATLLKNFMVAKQFPQKDLKLLINGLMHQLHQVKLSLKYMKISMFAEHD